MKPAPPATRRPKGRPRSFDRDAALRQAMLLFWRHGYESTSLNDLTTVMGVTPPSIYAAFGDKRGLFREALACYLNGPVTSATIIAGAATAREAASNLLNTSAIAFTGADTPPGCMLASAAISCSAASEDVRADLADIRRRIGVQLRGRIEHDANGGTLPRDTDAESLSAHTMAVIQGMSTLARDGAPRETLLRVAESAMRCWPAATGARE